MTETFYVDMHCHCPDYGLGIIREYLDNNYVIVSVSEDWDTINKNLEYKRSLGRNFYICLGIHPWVIHKHSVNDVDKIVELALKNDVDCIGEVGLDKIFVPKTFNKQLVFFKKFLEAAREYDFLLNLHTPGTWETVYNQLVKYDIRRAYFHWYTGPLRLLESIRASGYFIGANPAWRIQDKHRRILEEAPLEILLTESDAPYRYKNIVLSPGMIPETVEYLAKTRGIEVENVRKYLIGNAKKLLGFS